MNTSASPAVEPTKETVLVTAPEFRKGEEIFRGASDINCESAPSEELALAESILTHRSRVVIVGVVPYRDRLYEALGTAGGGLIARFGVGHDTIDKALARQHRLVVTNTPGALDISVAEHTIWLLGSLARRIAFLHLQVRAGQFAAKTGTEMHGKTLGILGFGHIGRRVARMAHFGFGMKVIAAGSRPPRALEAAERRGLAEILPACGADAYTDDVEQIFRQSDVLSVHIPANAETRQFVNRQRLAWLRPTALLINTARGSVLDEEALYDALAAGRLAGAALDVFAVEPYRPAHPDKDLRRLDNVALTPHVGSNTREANARMATACLANVRHFLAGHYDQMNRVDLQAT